MNYEGFLLSQYWLEVNTANFQQQCNSYCCCVTHYTPSWVLFLVTHLLSLLLGCISGTLWGWPFKGWNMLQWHIALIKWSF